MTGSVAETTHISHSLWLTKNIKFIIYNNNKRHEMFTSKIGRLKSFRTHHNE